jgi:hypothetical protein
MRRESTGLAGSNGYLRIMHLDPKLKILIRFEAFLAVFGLRAACAPGLLRIHTGWKINHERGVEPIK